MNKKQIQEDILALYKEVVENPLPFHRKLDLFIVPDYLVTIVLESIGVDIKGHWVSIDNFGIEHALEHHGNPISEAKRGQIAVEKEDFITLIDIILAPDEVNIVGGTRRTKLPLIQFVKNIDNKTFIVKEIRTISSTKKHKLSRLMFHTMYKVKANK
jgi:hypothetical protein